MEKAMVEILTAAGYHKEGHGYKKVTESNTHWVTLFGEGELQMYAYASDDDDMDKVYDTGILDVVMRSELSVLIDVFNSNHE